MGIYISSDGTQQDTAMMGVFNLVNGLIKSVKKSDSPIGSQNVENLKAELLARLDTRPVDHELVVPLSEDELQELQDGRQFNWIFTTNKGVTVHVLVKPQVEEDK